MHPQPGRPDRPVRRADAGRPRLLRPDAGQQRAGHRLPGGDRLGRRSPAPRRTRWRRRSRSASNPPSAGSTASTRSTARSVEGNSTTFVQFQLGTPTDRAVNDVRNAIVADPQQPSRRHSRAAGRRASTPRTSRSSYVGAQTTDMTLEQLSWYIDNTVAKRLLGAARASPPSQRVGGVDRDDPGDPRSRRAAGAGHHRGAGQPAASPEQHERRRRPRRDRRFRAVGARARQRAGRLSAVADADRASRRPLRQARRSRRGEGQQLASSARSPR